jgi:hypothetical protein
MCSESQNYTENQTTLLPSELPSQGVFHQDQHWREEGNSELLILMYL